MEKKEPMPRVDTLRSEHLTHGELPLVACVDMPDFPDPTIPYNVSEMWSKTRPLRASADFVDYYGDPEKLTEAGFLINGSDIYYVISPLNSNNKFSTKFYECTGVAAVGRDAQTGENISLLSHEDPYGILPEKNPEINTLFKSHLKKALSDLKNRCVPGSIDAIIAGGRYLTTHKEQVELYRKSIEMLRNEVSAQLGFEPVVIVGPKNMGGYPDSILIDTKNRRLYIDRPNVGNTTTESYRPEDLEKQEKKWVEEEKKKR